MFAKADVVMKEEILQGVALLFLLLCVLDCVGADRLSRRWQGAVALFAAPHGLLLWQLGTRPQLLWLLVGCLAYYLLRMVRPEKQYDCPRGRGRWLRDSQLVLGSVLTGLLAQPFFYWWVAGQTKLPWQSYGLDALAAGGLLLLLLARGALPVLLCSKRLGFLKRLLVVCNLWVPLLNLALVWYLARKAGEEYDHICTVTQRLALRAQSDECATRYPLVMVHGVGFRDLKYFDYWGRIPRELSRYGARIYYGHQQAWGTVEDNAQAIAATIEQVLQQTNCQKVNLIAHSKGGLDARYLITHLGMGEKVASLTSISTPHRGSPLVDVLCKLPQGIYRFLTGWIDSAFHKLGDEKPNSFTASRQLTPAFCAQFNADTPDCPGVYYQSYATVMKGFYSDFLLCIPYLLLRCIDGPNDGLVCVPSAQWGDFKGVLRGKFRRGISHGDAIDLKRQDYRGFEITETYIEIVKGLKNMGY